MAKGQNQKLKLVYLMKLFNESTDETHALSMKELIEALAAQGIPAERKSIYDDIEALRLFGVDIEKNRENRYFVANRTFQLPELKLLVDAIQSSKFITRRKSNELIKKLESLASVHEARLLQRQVYVANRIKTMNESIYYNIDKLHAAISAGRQITCRYFDWVLDFKDATQFRKQYRREGGGYVVSPWALTWEDENYYLIGYDSPAQMIKHYRVDKMERIELLDLPRDGQVLFERFDMAVYSKKVFGMFGGCEERVTLRFENRFAGVVADRFGVDVRLQKAGEEHFFTTLQVVPSEQFFSWLFGLGNGAMIVSPQKLRGQFARMAGRAALLHQSEQPSESGEAGEKQ